MKVAIYGAGSIGGHIAACLAHTREVEVTMIARGKTLEAINGHGLRIYFDNGEKLNTYSNVRAVEDPAAAGPQDYVILALKAPVVRSIADAMQPLLGGDTAIVTAMNGVPWWYFHAHGDQLEGARLESVDPNGELSRKLPPARCLGCVVYPAAEIVEPGVIRHEYGNRYMLGEPDGSKSERAQALSRAMTAGGLKAPVRRRIRDDIWLKLWGNVAFNPISALSLGTLAQIAGEDGTRRVARAMMVEAQAVAEALGVKMSVEVDTRIKWAADVGEHKTSMLQDLERGRTMEVDSMVTAVSEIADKLGIETPTIDTVLGLLIQRAKLAGCY
ncbi:2-dehydropantoate 2-reductase [Rhodovibrio sodomensis]|uniref:2-dehydropantoate 2-reductase n=1 Tax=Rhodovibrio sodomensis TaxID=1088 RepID=A0ABS1DDL9_9PROT|nr:2-dehydropantoate 2-reductase [Rhodovibrio sodomensis]